MHYVDAKSVFVCGWHASVFVCVCVFSFCHITLYKMENRPHSDFYAVNYSLSDRPTVLLWSWKAVLIRGTFQGLSGIYGPTVSTAFYCNCSQSHPEKGAVAMVKGIDVVVLWFVYSETDWADANTEVMFTFSSCTMLNPPPKRLRVFFNWRWQKDQVCSPLCSALPFNTAGMKTLIWHKQCSMQT